MNTTRQIRENQVIREKEALTIGVRAEQRSQNLEGTFAARLNGGDVIGGLDEGGPEGGRVVERVHVEEVVRYIHGAPALAVDFVDERLDELLSFLFFSFVETRT